MRPTQRTYTNVETGRRYRLFNDSCTGAMELRAEDEVQEVLNGAVYLCAFDSVTIRLNNDKRISLGHSEFYALKPGEKVTHQKFAGFKNFRRI